jgi:hypothetical protein
MKYSQIPSDMQVVRGCIKKMESETWSCLLQIAIE